MNQTCVSINENSLHRKITLCVFSPINYQRNGKEFQGPLFACLHICNFKPSLQVGSWASYRPALWA